MNHQTELIGIIQLFESLSQENLNEIRSYYASHAYFKDPFNEVHGHDAIIAIFRHMFMQVNDPKFVVTNSALQNDDAFIVWNFSFRPKDSVSMELHIHGSSHLRFGENHKVYYHRDYWDTAEELYEKVALLGSLMRFLKRKVPR